MEPHPLPSSSPEERIRAKAFVVVVIVLAVVLGCVAASIYILRGRLPCVSKFYDDTNYLSYCANPYFGDYEHGMYYFGLEPGVTDALKKAQVVFVGNSQGEVAFSGAPLRALLDAQKIPFYIAAYGYGASMRFSQLIIDRWNVQPKIYVVATNNFFIDNMHEVAQRLPDHPLEMRLHYWGIYASERILKTVCPHLARYCTNMHFGVFRSRIDGHAEWGQAWSILPQPLATVAIPEDKRKLAYPTEDKIAEERARAKAFIARTQLPPECIVFVGIPNSYEQEERVNHTLAAGLGVTEINVPMTKLLTYDTSHFTAESQARWNAAFAKKLMPVVERCLKK